MILIYDWGYIPLTVQSLSFQASRKKPILPNGKQELISCSTVLFFLEYIYNDIIAEELLYIVKQFLIPKI